MHPIIIPCLMGPTASGKTDIALQLADHFPLRLISVDSALIYRGMNIGTAKPNAQTLATHPHALIDICEPTEHYSAATFCHDVLQILQELFNSPNLNQYPLLVGGTMMYFNALFKGLSPLPQANPTIRKKLNALLKEKGSAYLHTMLAKIDPFAAQKIHQNDPQRLQRALEVIEITGKPLSENWQTLHKNKAYDYLKIALTPAHRHILHERIALRFEKMLAENFIDEVKTLMQNKTLSLDYPAMRAVGYRQMYEYLNGLYDFDTMKEKAIAATRQLAKRQLTWLRSFDDVYWFDSQDPKLLDKIMALLSKKIPIHFTTA